MTEDRYSDDLSFDEVEEVEFNPLEGFSFAEEVSEEEELVMFEDGPYNLPNTDAVPVFQKQLISFANSEVAEERIEALFNQMPTLHSMLYSILDRCKTPVPDANLQDVVAELQKNHHCIYDPATLCNLLERAGAIEKTDSEGTPLSTVQQEPLKVVVDGNEYWKVAPAPEVFWGLTPSGNAKLESYKPLETIASCFDYEPAYKDIYKSVLELCSREGGISLRDIGDVVNDEPILRSPRRMATFFVDRLERAGAVAWNGKWGITDAGREFLNTLTEDQEA